MYKVVAKVWRSENIETIKFECRDLSLAKKFAWMVFDHNHGGINIEVDLMDEQGKCLSWD